MAEGDPRVLITNPGEAKPEEIRIPFGIEGEKIALIYRNRKTGNIEVAYNRARFPSTVEVEKVFREAADQVIAQLFRITMKLTGHARPS